MNRTETAVVDEDTAVSAPRTCDRCGTHLRRGNEGSLCFQCDELVASCAPFVPGQHDQAPEDVNLVELVAGIMLTHDALHPGETLYLREALAQYGVDADHVRIWQAVGKLRRRHGLIMRGEPREPGYSVEDWLWEARRVRSSIRETSERVALPVATASDNQR